MDWVLLLGRLLFIGIFLMSGLTVHLLQRKQGIEYARMKGVPMPELLVPFSGLMAVAGALLIATGLWADLGALILVLFIFPVAFGMHAFWKETEPMARMMEQVQFTKDVALGGAALCLFSLFQQFGDEIGLTLGPTSLFG
jgi:putative oxidoreductase